MDRKQVANMLVRQFDKSNMREPNGMIPKPTVININAITFMEELASKSMSLKEDTSPGKDEISVTVLKIRCGSLSPLACEIFQQSMEASKWREAILTPIYKTGNGLDPGNYCPVSLISILCKVMEKIVQQLK